MSADQEQPRQSSEPEIDLAAEQLSGFARSPAKLVAVLEKLGLTQHAIRCIRDWTGDQMEGEPTEKDVQLVMSMMGRRAAELGTFEQRSAAGKAGMKARTVTERSEMASRGGRAAADHLSAEERSERARKAAEARWSKKGSS